MRGVQRRCEAVGNVDQAFIIGEICNEEIDLLVITRCSYRKVQVRGSMRMATEGAQNISDWPIVWLQTSVNGESKQRTKHTQSGRRWGGYRGSKNHRSVQPRYGHGH